MPDLAPPWFFFCHDRKKHHAAARLFLFRRKPLHTHLSTPSVFVQTVGRCGSFRLDGRVSSGGASRTLSALWSVSAAEEGSSFAALAAADASLAPFQGSLLAELNATALEVGVEFTFSLAVRNFLGSVDEATATLTRRSGTNREASVRGVPSVELIPSRTAVCLAGVLLARSSHGRSTSRNETLARIQGRVDVNRPPAAYF